MIELLEDTRRVTFDKIKIKRLLIFSDPHITTKAEFSKPTDDGLTDYIHQVQRSFIWINELVAKTEPDAVFCLGDIFESTGHVDTTSLKVATEIFQNLKYLCDDLRSQLVFLVGNHDTYSEEYRIHNLEFLRMITDNVIDKPTLLWGWVYCIPWTSNIRKVKIPSEARICMTHLDAHGGIMSSGRICDFGVDPSDFELYTFNGHQHAPASVTDRFINVGSLLSRSFCDSVGHFPRGATLVSVDLADRTDKDIEIINYANPHEIPFHTIEIMNDDDAKLWSDEPSGYECTYLCIKCVSKNREVAELVGCLSAGARIEEVPESKFEDENQTIVNESFSPEENFRNAVSEVFMFDEKGDRERILRYGLEAISKSKKQRNTTHAASIEFRLMRAENFHSLGNITINLRDQGLVAILGGNGAGKSSIAEAIFWALTGESLRGYVGDDVIRWGYKDCSVEIEFIINNKHYTIVRTRHPNKVRLWVGEEEISCRRNDDTKKIIEDLIDRDKRVLQHSVFLTSDLQVRFTGLSYPDRIKLVEQVTGADIYTDVYKLVHSSLGDSLSEMDRESASKAQIAKQIEALTERQRKITGQITETIRDQKLGRGKLKSELVKALNTKVELQNEITKLEESSDKATALFGELDAKVCEATNAVSAVSRKLLENNTIRNQIKIQLTDAINKVQAGNCPTCGQSIDDDAPINDLVNVLKQDMARLLKSRNELNEELNIANVELDNAKGDLEGARSPGEFITEIGRKNKSMRSLDKWINKTKIEIQKQSSVLDSLTAARDEINEQLSIANKSSDELAIQLEVQEREIYAWEWLVNIFSTTGIRAKVLSTVTMPYLNSRIELYSDRLGMPCKLTNKTETKGGKIEDKLDIMLAGDRTYKGCSRGERRKVDLAIQKSFNDLATRMGGNIGLLVCDEIVDPLDDASMEAFTNFLREGNQTVLLMTHKRFSETLADKKIQLVKSEDGETKIISP